MKKMLQIQKKLMLSQYSELYNIIIPKDNLLRKIKELIDFSFVYEELRNEYCIDNGRNAIDPVIMFKYLLLKTIYDVSDVDVVERSRYDMSFKYFLDITPEESVINESSLTKFRRQRLKNSNLIDLLINKTVAIAIEKGIIKSKSIIVDSTHTKSRYNQKSPVEMLKEVSKNLRKSVYAVDESMKGKLPEKITSGILEEEIKYCEELIKTVESNEKISSFSGIKSKLNLLKEKVDDDIENIKASKDEDAKVGHKTADSSFFGYKTHMAMTEERIITGAIVTTGEKNDGKQLEELVRKSKEAGIDVMTIIGDGAYSEKANIEYSKENKIELVSKLSKTVTHGNTRTSGNFDFNKDAGMYVCKAGHLSIKKAVNGKKKRMKTGQEMVETYFFDVEKCRNCPQREGCYKPESKTKTYSVTISSSTHQEQKEFQETEYFKMKAKERYKIEAKNSELKHSHGYDVASSSGLFGMEMQGALAIFTVNLKRILTLMN